MTKKRRPSKKPAQTNSFQNMVNESANQKAVQLLNNHVAQLVEQRVAFATAELSKRMLSNVVEILYRLRNLEDIGGLTKDDVENAVLKYQDEAWGLKQVDRPAQKGDFLRITYSFEFDGKLRQENETGIIDELMKDTFSPNDLPKELHEALLGKSVGETIEVEDTIETGGKDAEGNAKKLAIKYIVTLNRVSEKLEKKNAETNTSSEESSATDTTQEGSQETGASG